MSTPVSANPVNWFELPVTDMDRAKKFYTSILDVEFTGVEMPGSVMAWFPMAPGVPGAAGSLVKGDGYVPSTSGALVYFGVRDVADTLTRVRDAGGNVTLDKTSIGEYGFIGLFEDLEGNRVGLYQRV